MTHGRSRRHRRLLAPHNGDILRNRLYFSPQSLRRSAMASSNLAARIRDVERELARLRSEIEQLKAPKDWRSTIGMFGGDKVMEEIFEEGRKIRERDRERARRATTTKQ